MIFAVRSNRDNASSPEVAPQRFAVIPFVQAQALGLTFALPDSDTLKCGKDSALIMPIGFAESEVERMPMRFDYEVPFEPENAVFAGVADLGRRPFFDLMTLAS
jgi:hypothetical protein